jgi:hypothetical protein
MTRYGDPIELRNFNRYFAARCASAGVRQITVHDVRRTCATLLGDSDVHPRIVMQILRYAQFDVTMEASSAATSAATREALKRLGAIPHPARPGPAAAILVPGHPGGLLPARRGHGVVGPCCVC